MTDLIIIGGGPAGYVAAERAAKLGMKTIIFDMRELGGVCLNEGCIPTKTLLYTAKLYENARFGEKYGIQCDNVTFDFKKIMARKNKVVKKLVGGVAAKMRSGKIEVVNEKAIISKPTKGGYIVTTNKNSYECKNILIATGSEAAVPPIKGLDSVTYYTNREILQIDHLPESLNIIGGGVIGIEFANFFAAMGTKVTVFEMLNEILPGTDHELSGMLRKELEDKGVNILLKTKVTEVKNNAVVYEKEGKTAENKAEMLLVCVGRKPNIEGIGLENVGVETLKNGIKIDNHCRTNLPNIYAAGDITGFSLLAHTASREGEVAVNTMAGLNDTMRYNAIPAVVYTNPEISGVGLTEDAAKAKNIDYSVVSLPMAYAGRFIAENEGKNGLCKILVGKKHKEILGVHMIGNPSSELIYGAAMAIEMQMRVEDMEQIVFPHPTVSEIFKETINAY